MIKKGMCTESVSRNPSTWLRINRERMLKYKEFASAFSYPDEEKLRPDYDRLFRAKEIWLYATEHLAKNEFQRANYLSDIMGFYRAFGVEPDRDRPDSLSAELEFMHYVIFKEIRALDREDSKEKVYVCVDAQKKFFTEYLYPAAKRIVESIRRQPEKNFYTEKARELLDFLESEKRILANF